MVTLDQQILKYAKENLIGKYVDDGSSGMKIKDFTIEELCGIPSTLYITLQDLGLRTETAYKFLAFTYNQGIYDSLKDLKEARSKKGETLIAPKYEKT